MSFKRILIVAPPYRLTQANFPLGLMYVGAALQEAGHHVEVIDMDVLNLSKEGYFRELKERNYNYLCAGGMITAWNFIVQTANLLKEIKPHVKMIVGGGIVNSTPKSLVSHSKVDVGVIGDGEEAIIDIINTIENGQSLSQVAGIVYKEGDRVIQTHHREYHRHLDDLPFPAWELFNVGEHYVKYQSASFFYSNRQADVYTTRGCPFQCTFCYTDKKVRQRSIPNVIEEIKELKRRYKIRHLRLADDLFVVRKNYTIEFCEAMIKNNLKLTWSATGRCNIITKELLTLYKRAGCTILGLGIESGSDAVLKRMKKNQTPEQIINAVKMCREVGIRPGGSFILGLPGETKETVKETLALYKTINLYRSHANRFFFATPYPGTSLYREMVEKGRIKDEIKYFEHLSTRGNAVDFCINCTDSFTDNELVQTKEQIEAEALEDFLKKHFIFRIKYFLGQRTSWRLLRKILLAYKYDGFKKGLVFTFQKICDVLKGQTHIPLPGEIIRRKTYGVQQTLIE